MGSDAEEAGPTFGPTSYSPGSLRKVPGNYGWVQIPSLGSAIRSLGITVRSKLQTKISLFFLDFDPPTQASGLIDATSLKQVHGDKDLPYT